MYCFVLRCVSTLQPNWICIAQNQTYKFKQPVNTFLNNLNIVMRIQFCFNITMYSFVVLLVPGGTEAATKIPLDNCIFLHWSEHCTLGDDSRPIRLIVSIIAVLMVGVGPTSPHSESWFRLDIPCGRLYKKLRLMSSRRVHYHLVLLRR